MKEKNSIVEHKVDFELCNNLITKADKYYISFRILNRCGFYFQGVTCLLFSLEIFFKIIYLLEKTHYKEEELKKIGHNLKNLAKKIKIDKNRFRTIYQIISSYNYTEMRYNDITLINELNHKNKYGKYLDNLNDEILGFHKYITHKMKEKFNIPEYNAYSIYKIHPLVKPAHIQKFIEECMSKGDEVGSIDNT